MKKIFSALILIALLPMAVSAQSGKLATTWSTAQLAEILPKVGQFKPVPTAASDYWRTTLPLSVRQAFITQANSLRLDWSQIPDSLFAIYMATGNRTTYENIWFSRKNNLIYLVMAEIMEHNGRFINSIVNGLNFYKQMVSWSAPAHYFDTYGTFYSTPRRDLQVVELYSLEVGNLISWAVYMLGDELETASPGICDTMKQEVQRRLNIPFLAYNMYYWENTTSNHNTWQNENLLSCFLLCETDSARLVQGVYKSMRDLDYFINGYPADGGCDEGPLYWNWAAGSYFEACNLLNRATNGAIDLSGDAYLRRLGSYIYDLHITGTNFVPFADTPFSGSPDVNMVYSYGHFVGDSALMQFGAYLGSLFGLPTSSFRAFSNDRPSVSRELMFLQLYNDFKNQKAVDPAVSYAWYPNTQVLTARPEGKNGAQGLFLAAKAGNNGELHNHNDIGNFIVYNNGSPVIIDIGMATYTAATFSVDQRYTLVNTRSLYHNVPLINNTEQRDSAQYKATAVGANKINGLVTMTQDIACAYPTAAGVKSWVRTLTYDGTTIGVTEDYELSRYTAAPKINYMLARQPILSTPGRATLRSAGGNLYLTYDTTQVSVSYETVNMNGVGASSVWGNTLYKLTLTPKSTQTSAKVSYSITSVIADAAATAVSLDRHDLTLHYDRLAAQLTPTVTPASAANQLKWTSSDEQVAVAGPYGMVAGLNSGDAIIKCYVEGGPADSCRVHVADGILSIDAEGDTFIDGGHQTKNYGHSPVMAAQNGRSDSELAAYLIFPLRGNLPAGFNSRSDMQAKIVLNLFYAGESVDDLAWTVYPVGGIRWSETGLTYATAPSPTLTNLLATVSERVAADTALSNRVEFDVTTYTKSRLSSNKVAYYLTQNINSSERGSLFYTHDFAPDASVHPRLVFNTAGTVDAIHAPETQTAPAKVDVYTIDGVLLRRGVQPERATNGLPGGIYIVGGNKIIV